jgi:hypothetical protein
MGKSTTFSNDLLKLIYNATAIANLADNAASAPIANIYVALHSADPGAGGVQNTSELSYTNYARQAVARTSGGWTVTSNSVSPVANIVFPASGSTTPTATHFSTGVAASGATKIHHSGTVTPNIVVSTTVSQTLTNASSISES